MYMIKYAEDGYGQTALIQLHPSVVKVLRQHKFHHLEFCKQLI